MLIKIIAEGKGLYYKEFANDDELNKYANKHNEILAKFKKNKSDEWERI